MKCKYFDCGWCYAPIDVVTSASSCGSCNYPEHCPEITNQLPEVMSSGTAIISDENGVPTKVHLSDKEKLTEMTKKMDSVESIEAQIKMLQSKLEFYKELEKTSSPVEKAFKDNYGVYPNELKTTDDFNCWKSFKRGYTAAQKDYKVGEHQEPTKKKSLYQFLAEWKYGIEEGDIIPQFDNDEFSVLDWSQIFIEYLYECGDIISEDKDEIVIKFKLTQLEIPND